MLQKLRNMLMGGGKPAVERRRVPRPGPCPNVGASIVRRNSVMKITEPITQDFWDWLVLSGWREVRMSRNKRRYEVLPADTLGKLRRSSAHDREMLHSNLLGPETR